MASNNSTWGIKPASPDALSKKLKKCKTRKERQMAVQLDALEREERRRAEQAAEEAANVAYKAAAETARIIREKAEIQAMIDTGMADMFTQEWVDSQYAKVQAADAQAAQAGRFSKEENKSVRPKTVRPTRANLKAPTPPKEMKWYYKRAGIDSRQMRMFNNGDGTITYTRPGPAFYPGAEVDGKFVFSENFLLYQKLQEMNLEDPETIKKIQEACATPEKKAEGAEGTSAAALEDSSSSAKKLSLSSEKKDKSSSRKCSGAHKQNLFK